MSADDKIAAMREKLGSAGLPVFARTVREVTSVATSKASSAEDLSEVIGKDASLAARLIRIANSPLFNLQNRHIDTISGAVVLTGFDAVRELAISVSVIEQMLQGEQHAKVTQHMARAFHAGAQAKAFAVQQNDPCPEEVFVAALLKEVGEMAFWSSGCEEAARVEALVADGLQPAVAEKQVLGFKLDELSASLAEDWSLGELLTHLHSGLHKDDPRVRNVHLAHRLARALEGCDWNTPAVQELLDEVADTLGCERDQVERVVHENLEEAIEIAERYGVPKVEESLLCGGTRSASAPAASDVSRASTAAGPDPAAQLQAFQAVALGLEQGRQRDELMLLLLDGAVRGLGVSRAYFALLTPDRKKLQAKYQQGANGNLDVRTLTDRDPLQHALLTSGTTMVAPDGNDPWLADKAAMALGIQLQGKPLGVLYAGADRALHESDEAALRMFGQQVVLVLSQAKN